MPLVIVFVTEEEVSAKKWPVSAEVVNEGRRILAQDPEDVAIGVIFKSFIDFLKKHKIINQKRVLHVSLVLCHPEKLVSIHMIIS